MEFSFGYTGVKVRGHNLWPYKLVTRIFQDAQATAHERQNIEVILHTKTPVTGFERIDTIDADKPRDPHPVRDTIMAAPGKALEFIKNVNDQRRWKLQTPRGSISCNYVVHATNGYTGHLLPFLAGQEPAEDQTSIIGTNSEAVTQIEEFQHSLSQSSRHILPKPRGVYGIIPTRGQVGAMRASVSATGLGWKNSWVNAILVGGGEYWFPRYQGLEGINGSDVYGIETRTGTRNENETAQMENMRPENPLIIIGGGRQNAGGNMESGETDDGVLNERVSKALREFLPRWFPGKFESGGGQGKDGWEMEWVSNQF